MAERLSLPRYFRMDGRPKSALDGGGSLVICQCRPSREYRHFDWSDLAATDSSGHLATAREPTCSRRESRRIGNRPFATFGPALPTRRRRATFLIDWPRAWQRPMTAWPSLSHFVPQADRPVKLPDFAWLADSQTPALVRLNMRLYYARWLAENNYDDEALSWTDGLSLTDVVAPDTLLFYRAIANHRLVHADQADVMLSQLLERPDDLPVRYQKLAVLMQKDLAGLDEESLDHVARRMADVRRRLTLGRTGKTVQGVENGVIDSLDKMIKKAEDQAQKQAQSAAASGAQPSSTPMQDSHLAELKAPGKVEPRDIGHGADWGNMNDKDREQAMQEIGREFPSHYREVIEEYFKQLATEPTDENHDGSGK